MNIMTLPTKELLNLSRRVLENLNTAILLLDQHLRLVYMNPAAEMLLAVSSNHARGQALMNLFPADEHFYASLRRTLLSGHPLTERELCLHPAGTEAITVDCTATPLSEPQHPKELLLEILRVDRQRRILREENLLAQHQAARALVRGLAHEIKNPLGGLRGAAQLLARELDDVSLTEFTDIIIGEADRLQNLVDRMLGPKNLPQKRPVNIHQILERVRTLVSAEAPMQIMIERDYDPSIPEVIADQDQLIQALLNIVRNAVQAIGTKGKIILRTRAVRQVTIGHRRHKLVIRIDVIDDGPGIPPEMIENIFYPMVTGRADGTGLGLSIAQSLVNQHHGLIECSSQTGLTTFTIWLPLETTDEQ